MYDIGDWVILIGCTVGKKNQRKKFNFEVANVIEVGAEDLIVRTLGYAASSKIVSKNSCRKIPVDNINVTSSIKKPKIGDLIMYFHEKYDSSIEKYVGHIIEIKYSPGKLPEGLIVTPDGEKWLDFKHILVLSVEQSLKRM